MKPKKLTADHVFSLIEKLPIEEKQELAGKVARSNDVFVVQLIAQPGMIRDALETTLKLVGDTFRKLQKHRKPIRNAERDAEIMTLHRKKMTAGQIVFALKDRYRLTDKLVNAVISRERRKQLKRGS